MNNKSTEAEETTPCDKTRILITDDDLQVCEMFHFAISSEFPACEVDVAHDGMDAFQLFQSKRHIALIMDLHMPVMDGLDAYAEIMDTCESDNIETPFFVFCTAYDPPHAISDIVKKNPEKCFLLRKPVNTEFLIDKLRNAVAS